MEEEKKYIFNIFFWAIIFISTPIYFLIESLDEWKNPELIILIPGLIISLLPLYLFIVHIQIYNKSVINSKYFQSEFYSNIICLTVLILTLVGNIQSNGEFMAVLFLIPLIFGTIICSIVFFYKGCKEVKQNLQKFNLTLQ